MSQATQDSAELRPVVMHYGAIGDMVAITPLLQCLHERFGKAPTLACSSSCQPETLFQGGHPHIGRLLKVGGLAKPYWFAFRHWRFVEYLRHGDAGPIYICDATRHLVRKLLRRSGVSEDRCLFSHDYPDLQSMNIYDRWVALGRKVPEAYRNIPIPEVPGEFKYRPRLHVSAQERDDVEQWLSARRLNSRNLVLIQPYSDSNGRSKIWPAQQWAQLCVAIREQSPEVTFLLSGSRAQRARIEQLRRNIPFAVDTATEDLPLRRLFALQEKVLATISIDTGPAHSAAALGCPVVILYGPWSPQTHKPVPGIRIGTRNPSPVVAVQASPASRDVNDITLEQAVNSWKILLAEIGASRQTEGTLSERTMIVPA